MKKALIRFFKSLAKKITNTNIFVSVVSLIILILTTWGVELPTDKIETTVQAICTLGVLLGIFTTNGTDTTNWNE